MQQEWQPAQSLPPRGQLRLRRLREGEEGQFQLDALVTAPGHMLKGAAQRTDGPDGLPLAQLRAFFEVLLFLFGETPDSRLCPPGRAASIRRGSGR